MANSPTSRQAKITAAAPKTPAGPSKILIAAVVAVLAIIGIVGGTIVANQRSDNAASAGGSAIPAGASGTGVGIVSNDSAATTGVPVLDIYEDFQCPFCAELEKAAGSEIRALEEAGKVTVRYNLLTFLDDNLGNDSSVRAANAATCAADAGKFQQYHDAVFANQPAKEGEGYTDAQLTQFAGDAGISGAALTTWQTCYDNRSHNQYVSSIQPAASKAGVNGTPTLHLNGANVDLSSIDLRNYQAGQLTSLIEAAIK